MTEAEWNSSTEPEDMLRFLRSSGKFSDRKLRLFAAASFRSLIHILPDSRQQEGIELLEQMADGVHRPDSRAVTRAVHHALPPSDFGDPYHVALMLYRELASGPFAVHRKLVSGSIAVHAVSAPAGLGTGARVQQSYLLRDISVPPAFRPVVFEPTWRTPTILTLAQRAYEDRHLPAGTLDPVLLGALADALQEVGCTDSEVLAHLRSPGPHVRGCWAVDLVLGRS